MNVKFINPVLAAMLDVLSTMAQLEPKPGKPTLKKNNVAHGDVSGIMSMVGEKATGSLAITFTEPVILDIAKRMLRRELPGIDDSVTDLVGEITNMVVGGAKGRLEKDGYDFEMSLPTVVSGKDHVVDHKAKGPKIVLPFSTDTGTFFVEICFEEG